MKQIFAPYNKKTPNEIKTIWDTGLITFDANVLLNLYRYSDETRTEILNIISKLSSKIFLTHQAGLEFHKNRFEIIAEQEKAYIDFNKNLKNLDEEIKSKSRPPFISANLQTKLNTIFLEVRNELEKTEKYYANLLINDKIYSEIERVFNGKVENPFKATDIEKIIEEGKKRYEKKTPPGYEDKGKEINQYGDLIIWKQIIEKAKKDKKPILFITDERKKDWWWKLKNDITIGPRHELVTEMKMEAGVDFYLYSTEKFIEYGLKYFHQENKSSIVNEVKELQTDKYVKIRELLTDDTLKDTRWLEKDLSNKDQLWFDFNEDELKTVRDSFKEKISLIKSKEFMSLLEFINIKKYEDIVAKLNERLR